MSKHSVLVIGCGSIGERHLRCFQKTGRAEVTACESNPALLQKMEATYGVKGRSHWQDAVKESFDAVVICTPAPLHVPMATAALDAGRHVLVEKPLSQSFDGLDGLRQARQRSGRQMAVAYVLRTYPILAEVRAFIRSGQLGRMRQATVVTGQAFYFFRPAYAQTYYRDRRTGGGAIQDALTHTVNWVESVLGPTDSVLCDCAHLELPDVEVEDTVHVSTRHGDALANFSINQFQSPNETTIQFNGAGGSVKVELHRARWGEFAKGASAWTWHEVPPLERDTPFVMQANAFLDQVEGQPSRLCSLEEAISTLRFNLAALASADAGARVTCASLHGR
ncbi:MAG: Gfo/Idh/MocA family oxidoreductase [Verrucomicrobia bacterium]|nr:Gfo/Idh/MocA family oxidoreductase [Verrucomicrobiota bacterium]